MDGWLKRCSLALGTAVVVTQTLPAQTPNQSCLPGSSGSPYAYYATQWRPFGGYGETITNISNDPPVQPLPTTSSQKPAFEATPVSRPRQIEEDLVLPPSMIQPKGPAPFQENPRFKAPDPRITPETRKILPPHYKPDDQPFTQNLLPANAYPELPPLVTEQAMPSIVPPHLMDSPERIPVVPMPPAIEQVAPLGDGFRRSNDPREAGEEPSDSGVPKAMIEMPIAKPAPIVRMSAYTSETRAWLERPGTRK